MKKLNMLLMVVLLLGVFKNYGQSDNEVIQTAAQFLLITPDARGAGLADMGVGTSTDGNSQFFNASKFAFTEYENTVSINYTPWLRNISPDVFLTNASYSKRINEKSAWAASVTYFSLGQIDFSDENENSLGTMRPNEFSIDGSYSQKLSENFSMGVSLRYIHLGRTSNTTNANAVNTAAIDISGYYESDPKQYKSFRGQYRAGFNISNIGPKVDLDNSGDNYFLPTNLRLGGSYSFAFNDFHNVTAGLEFNKLLVPSSDPNSPTNDVGFIGGMFDSFFDDGASAHSLGLSGEYAYNEAFFLRAGYYAENQARGGFNFATLGGGVKIKNATIDLSYLVNNSSVSHPIENTLRFSLRLNFGGAANTVKAIDNDTDTAEN
ncbi:type IX secretion system outer membrane channel protein PorV [Tenacibaculum tangerinum]|uniref:Type IX secretion system outer membrane channel protein PorV n=1 Tax=Tenacibaculum tangerinum TaxID=3038772 RepID=A0ABY8L1B5_9FLAO|nr:type IX secretion system outer membrane channel protein PorV [Tenacibaculum tangerinum]WGH74133.1 type IX secretion system outer membrane channel protein PorV [Tenacibaculum tangerinum]